MWKIVGSWLRRYFSDPEAVSLLTLLLVAIVMVLVLGNILVPIIASIIIAYMLTGFVNRLETWKIPHLFAVIIVYLFFIGAILALLLWLFPLLFQQLGALFSEVPHMLNRGQLFLTNLQLHHSDLFSAAQLQRVLGEFNQIITHAGQIILSFSLSSIGNAITIIVYLILVPLLVFFFLKDGAAIAAWLVRFLPAKRSALVSIWNEVDGKIGDYIRGKVIEIIIVALVTVVAFMLMGINYAILLGVLVGFSVIIPYIGAVLVTIPVVAVSLLQWGWSGHFAYLIIIYAAIIAVDANILVPVLFSEKMKLHPVVIMLAVLVFGGLWGFWGVFFAIPLATLVNALLKGWPRTITEE